MLDGNNIVNIDTPAKAYHYALVRRKRIPELEPIILRSKFWAQWYVVDVIKERWLELEQILLNSTDLEHFYTANRYLYHFPEARTPSKDVPLVIENYAIMDVPNTTSDEQVIKLFTLMEPNINVTKLKTIKEWRVYFEPLIKRNLLKGSVHKITIDQVRTDKHLRKRLLENIGCYNYVVRTDFE